MKAVDNSRNPNQANFKESKILSRDLDAVLSQWSIKRAPLKREVSQHLIRNLGSISGCCVMAGTLVTMADGSTKTIESFKGGEKVLTLGGTGVVTKLEIVKLGVTRRMLELDPGDGESLYITDDHPIWTNFGNGDEWWGTYNFNHYLFEKETGSGSHLKRDATPLRFDLQNTHAHISGWKKIRPVFCQLSPETPVYQIALDTGGSYIGNDFVIISHAQDEDGIGVQWKGIKLPMNSDAATPV